MIGKCVRADREPAAEPSPVRCNAAEAMSDPMSISVSEALAPLVVDARSLIRLRREITRPTPDAASEAMGERAQEAGLTDAWSAAPVLRSPFGAA
jgi:hypothetical protein